MLLKQSSAAIFVAEKFDHSFRSSTSPYRVGIFSVKRVRSCQSAVMEKTHNLSPRSKRSFNPVLACRDTAARGSHRTSSVSEIREDIPFRRLSEMIVGVLGGGQLGRMLCEAASQMAIKVMVLDPSENCPASAMSYSHMVGSFDNSATMWCLDCGNRTC